MKIIDAFNSYGGANFQQTRSNGHSNVRMQGFGRVVAARCPWPLSWAAHVPLLLFALVALACSACANSSNPLLSSGPYPRAEDCALVQQATPSRYVCNGKIYTSVQLDQIRNGQQVQLSQQASHGAFPANVISPTGNFGTYPQTPQTP
jgi:hypothetical protein